MNIVGRMSSGKHISVTKSRCTSTVVAGRLQWHASTSHRAVLAAPDSSAVIRKKWALLRRMLHACESASMFAGPAKPRGRDARRLAPERVELRDGERVEVMHLGEEGLSVQKHDAGEGDGGEAHGEAELAVLAHAGRVQHDERPIGS